MYQMGDREDMERLNDNLGDRGMAWTFVDDVKILKTTTPAEDENEPVITTAVESIHGGKIKQHEQDENNIKHGSTTGGVRNFRRVYRTT